MTLPGFIPRPSQDNTDEIVKIWRTVRSLQKTSGNSGALGYVGSATNLAAGSIGVTEVMHDETVTFNATTGRFYEISYTLNLASSGSSLLTSYFRIANGPTVSITDTVIRYFVISTLNGAYTTYARECFWRATFTGQCTIGVSRFVNTGTATIDPARERDLLVKDIGI